MEKEDLGEGTWRGKKLKDMSREELYAVIHDVDQLREAQSKQYFKDLESLRP